MPVAGPTRRGAQTCEITRGIALAALPRMKLALASAAVLGLSLLPPAAPAQACSWPMQGSASIFEPHDGALDVPTNARLWLTISGTRGLDGYQVHLRPVGGSEVETALDSGNGTWFYQQVLVLKPGAPLAPATTYEVLDNQRRPCDSPDDCTGPDFAVIATFTTGVAADDEAPRLGPTPTLEVAEYQVGEDSCGRYNQVPFAIHWREASDASPVSYELWGEGGAMPLARLFDTGMGGAVACGEEQMSWSSRLNRNGRYVVRAVDIAGNMTASAPVLVNIVCPAEAPGGTAAEQALGCQVGAGRASRSGALVLLLVVGVFAAVVRRRARPGTGRVACRPMLRSLLCAALLCFAAACTGSGEAPPKCDYFGTLHEDGEIFPAKDGCNSCKCNPHGDTPGRYGCSLVLCNPPDAGPPDASTPPDAGPPDVALAR